MQTLSLSSCLALAIIFVAVAWLPSNHCFTDLDFLLSFQATYLKSIHPALWVSQFSFEYWNGPINHFHYWINYKIYQLHYLNEGQ